ncbi:MAG: TonB-dependent receptor [Acidobacteria bacterium]|nr:TonB-dependent receptor [Acidobacteriota bacterium]
MTLKAFVRGYLSGRKILTLMVLVLLGGNWALAQVTTGTVSGTATDSSGAVLPGVKIEVMSETTGLTRTVVTNATGHYSAPQLTVGEYRVSATLEGFKTEVRSGVVLTIGREAVIDLQMSVGAVAETVEVTGEAPLVQTTESTVSYIVDDRTIRELPLNGRDMTQLILLNPGVTISVNSPANSAFSGYGKRVSISGMRGEDNIYLLDGGLIGDFRRHIPAGPSGALLGIETVQEFQVLTSSFSAQYGRALGGVFNAVSKGGTNEFHGNAYDFLRNSAVDARDFFDRKRFADSPRLPPFRRNQFGATFGGPVQQDKTFFFLAYESTREVKTSLQAPATMDADLRRGILKLNGNPTGVTAPINPIMIPYINQYPLPSPQGRAFGDGTAEFLYDYKQRSTEHFGQTRVDLPSLTAQDSFFVRFTGSSSTGNAPNSFPGFEQVSSLKSWLATLSETHIVSPTTLNTFRFHFNRVIPLDTGNAPAPGPGITLTPGQENLPMVSPTGLTSYGGAGFDTDPTYMVSNRFSFQDDVNITIGGHSLQVGGMLERLQFNGSFPNRSFGVWGFTNVPNFLAGVANTYRGPIPGQGTYERGFRNWAFALYLQDDWRVTPKLTVNLGVRWEPQTVPTEVANRISNLRYITDNQGTVGSPYWKNTSWDEFGPRVGFAYSPFDGGKTSIRGGAGMLYEPNDPNLYYTQMVRNPPLGYDFTIAVPANLQRFPDAQAQINAQNTSGPGYAIPFDNMRSPHALQYNLNLQQQFGAANLVTVGFVGSRGINLLSVGDINMPQAVWDGVSLAMPDGATLRNPTWSSVVYYANDTSSFYNGLLTTYQRRFSAGLQGQVSFTWSKNISETDAGQTASAVTPGGGRMKYPHDHFAQRGLSGYDFRRILTFSYTYELPFGKNMGGVLGKVLSGWQTTGVLTIRDGQAQSVLATVSAALTPLAVTPRSPNANPNYKGEFNKGGSVGCSISSTGVVYLSPDTPPAGTALSRTIAAGAPLGTPELYFDPCAYSAPGARQLGNLARNTLIGPGAIAWNPALSKKTSITERTSLEFRAEFFNILNRPNLGIPASTVYNGTGAAVGTAGVINGTSTTSRQMQFALKLVY